MKGKKLNRSLQWVIDHPKKSLCAAAVVAIFLILGMVFGFDSLFYGLKVLLLIA